MVKRNINLHPMKSIGMVKFEFLFIFVKFCLSNSTNLNGPAQIVFYVMNGILDFHLMFT